MRLLVVLLTCLIIVIYGCDGDVQQPPEPTRYCYAIGDGSVECNPPLER